LLDAKDVASDKFGMLVYNVPWWRIDAANFSVTNESEREGVMLNLPMALLFTAMTFLSWGVYGILLHEGQDRLGHSSLRSFIGVGIAYFLIAVLGAAILLSTRKEKGVWSLSGILLSLFAGSVGALGALGVLLALTFKGAPIFVMPLVFGLAPVVNTLVTSWMGKTYRQISPKFITGLALVALGAVGVLLSKPAPAKAATSGGNRWSGDGSSPGGPGGQAGVGQHFLEGLSIDSYGGTLLGGLWARVASGATEDGRESAASVLLRWCCLLCDCGGSSTGDSGCQSRRGVLEFLWDALVDRRWGSGSDRSPWDHFGVHVWWQADFCHAASLRICTSGQYAGLDDLGEYIRQGVPDVLRQPFDRHCRCRDGASFCTQREGA
jgi:hypothetical protein